MAEIQNDPKTPRQYARLFFTGFAMGSADIVPGVSGGTMAFILGVYEDLINAIKSFNIDLVRTVLARKFAELFEMVPWRFLIALGSGIAVAILTLVRLLEPVLENPEQRVFLFAFFFGLILASIIAVGGHVRWAVGTGISVMVGAVFAFWVVGLVPVNAPNTPQILFLSGMIAITAMILPGISGSFMLLILGQYDFVISAIGDFNIVAIASLGMGCVVGIVIFSRILSWLLRHYEQLTVAALVGFMVGSLRTIWPWKAPSETMISDGHGDTVPLMINALPPFASTDFLIALGFILLGFVLVTALDHAQSRSNPVVLLVTGGKKTNADTAPAEAGSAAD